MYLAIRSDKSEAEIYLLNSDGSIVKQKVWEAARTLARDLPGEIDDLLNQNYDDLGGVIVYKGPGSFTGLRIGITVANAIAYAKGLNIVATSGDDWLHQGAGKLRAGINDQIALPEYGAVPHITPAKK